MSSIPPSLWPPHLSGNLASRGARLAAGILDGLIFIVPFVIIVFLIDGAAAFKGEGEPSSFAAGVVAAYCILLGGTQIFLLTTRGQTVGKSAMKVKIISLETRESGGFVRSVLLRELVGKGLISAIPILGWAYSVINPCFIFSSERRCIHDYIGSTIVVKKDI